MPVVLKHFIYPFAAYFSDVWGPAIESFSHKKYYVSFIDDYSKFTWIYLICHKSDVFKYFFKFQSLVDRMFNHKIISVQSDWGREYERLNSLFCQVGIAHQVSCPHTINKMGLLNASTVILLKWA
jgi:hypothetical protein